MTTSSNGGGGAKEATPLFFHMEKKKKKRGKKPPKPEEDDEEKKKTSSSSSSSSSSGGLHHWDSFLCGFLNEKHTDDDAFKARVKARYHAAGSRDSCGLFSLGRGWQELCVAARPPGRSSGSFCATRSQLWPALFATEEEREEEEEEKRKEEEG